MPSKVNAAGAGQRPASLAQNLMLVAGVSQYYSKSNFLIVFHCSPLCCSIREMFLKVI
jgi:hypothetical protein